MLVDCLMRRVGWYEFLLEVMDQVSLVKQGRLIRTVSSTAWLTPMLPLPTKIPLFKMKSPHSRPSFPTSGSTSLLHP